MSFCASNTKAIFTTPRAARPAAAMLAPRCEAVSAVSRAKQVGVALLSTAVVSLASPVLADGDIALGEEVFNGNCAACHAGGGNTVAADRTLSKKDVTDHLEGGFNKESIKYQVQNGKNAMPAWQDSLDEEEIDGVVEYVYAQIEKDWS